MASIRKRARAGGRFVWVVDCRDGAGRRRLRTCASEREAKDLAAKLHMESRQASAPALVDPNSNVRDYAHRWLELCGVGLKPKTCRSYEQQLRLHIEPVFGLTRVRDLHRSRIQSFLAELITGRKLARNSVRIVHGTLRSMLSAAVDDGVLQGNPAIGAARRLRLGKRPAEEVEEVHALTTDQLETLLEAAGAEGFETYALFFLMASCGARIGEALGLKWTDYGEHAREIRISRTLAAQGNKAESIEDRLGTPKSGKARTIDVTRRLSDVLDQLRALRRERSFRTGSPIPPWVFASVEGAPLEQSRIRKAFARALKRADLPAHFSPHSLRHTYAVSRLQRGAPLTYVQAQLGHSSIQMTADIYGRWLPTGDKTWVDRLDRSALDEQAAAALGHAPEKPDGDQFGFLVTNGTSQLPHLEQVSSLISCNPQQ